MKNLWLNSGLIVFFFVVGFMGIFGHSLFAMDLAKSLEIKKYHSKLESVLGRYVNKKSLSKGF